MEYAAAAGVLSFLGGLALQSLLIYVQRRFRVTQVQKSYGIGIDAELKAATPAMGGLAFIVAALLALGSRWSAQSLFFWALPVACGIIGFWDDWLKFSRKSSEGFSSPRKLAIQAGVTFLWCLWALERRKLALWPGLEWPAGILLALPLSVLAVTGMMNAVNVTDGLDGLAGGAFVISLGVLGYLLPSSDFLSGVFAVLLGSALSFLFYNVHPARVFMGDTGSHFLGGALVALCAEGGVLLALLPAGFIFGVELFSSALQIAAIRKFGRKIFKMAPLHHHFQRAGWDETAVTLRFLLVHTAGAVLGAALCVKIWGLR
jgi:phospho-N-acetylmuramoyl-pentapeptide-transferase